MHAEEISVIVESIRPASKKGANCNEYSDGGKEQPFKLAMQKNRPQIEVYHEEDKNNYNYSID